MINSKTKQILIDYIKNGQLDKLVETMGYEKIIMILAIYNENNYIEFWEKISEPHLKEIGKLLEKIGVSSLTCTEFEVLFKLQEVFIELQSTQSIDDLCAQINLAFSSLNIE